MFIYTIERKINKAPMPSIAIPAIIPVATAELPVFGIGALLASGVGGLVSVTCVVGMGVAGAVVGVSVAVGVGITVGVGEATGETDGSTNLLPCA